MVKILIASAVIFVVLAGWVWVQQRYDTFARLHPRLGPFRPEDGGCGGGCACKGGQCGTRQC